ncbi:MAG TPA: hypothetical protein VJ816_10425, partial [Gemmatimonadales bacterium]|nr:hypothetical protein [Gemmatimonadales bacterium]
MKVLLVVPLLFPLGLAAQAPGIVYGSVTDSAGVAVPRAVVHAVTREPARRVIASTVTDAGGRYR